MASLPRVNAPVLLFRSGHDAVVPPISSDIFLDAVGSTRIRTVELADSAHVATLDAEAERVLEETASFVADLRDAADSPRQETR